MNRGLNGVKHAEDIGQRRDMMYPSIQPLFTGSLWVLEGEQSERSMVTAESSVRSPLLESDGNGYGFNKSGHGG